MNKVLALLVFGFAMNVSASSYYDSFIYKMQGDCKNIESIISEDMFTNESIKLGKDDKGVESEAWVAVQLFEDGKYWAEYGEAVVETGEPTFDKNGVEGTWKVENDVITLENLGTGKPGKGEQNADVIEFTFSSNVNSPNLMNQVTKFYHSSVGLGPKYVTPEVYCQTK